MTEAYRAQAVQPSINDMHRRPAALFVTCTDVAGKQGLEFPILTDHGNKVGEAYGLAFHLPDDLVEVYKKIGVDLPHYNGDDSWRLSMPARIVIRRDGIVVASEVEPDYTRRPEVEPTLELLRNLS